MLLRYLLVASNDPIAGPSNVHGKCRRCCVDMAMGEHRGGRRGTQEGVGADDRRKNDVGMSCYTC